ncbi:MAG: PIN domain-containing protein [Firmicutes bacterium]|nr:PIN domain-containing protein [Bacillota bacterium]
MALMVDTSAWYAICDTSDSHHPRARAFYERVVTSESLLTTVAVFVETWTLLAARLGRDKALIFWQTLRETGIPILSVEQADVEAAWRIMVAFPDQNFSFTDCTTFAVMERLGLERVFAFDRHFLVYRYGPNRRRAFKLVPSQDPS